MTFNLLILSKKHALSVTKSHYHSSIADESESLFI